MEKLFPNVQKAIKLIGDNSGGDRRTNHKNVIVVGNEVMRRPMLRARLRE